MPVCKCSFSVFHWMEFTTFVAFYWCVFHTYFRLVWCSVFTDPLKCPAVTSELCWWHHPVDNFGGRTTGLGGPSRWSQQQIQPTHQYRQNQGNGQLRHSVSHSHSQLVQVNTFPYLGSLITEDGEYVTEFRTRLSRGQAIGASLQKIWKSHSIPISTTTRLMKALVWPVATYGCESWILRKMKKHVLRPLRWKDWERFCVFRGQQRKQMSEFSTKLE